MQAIIVSDLPALTQEIREVLYRQGHICPSSNLFAVDSAVPNLAKVQPELILVVLGPDVEKALGVLGQLHILSKAPILAVGPTRDSRLVLRTLRAGAADFLDETALPEDFPAALGRLQFDDAVHGEPARTLAVLGPSGGCGSSTLAVNIATSLARDHKSALLVDLKLLGGDLAALLDLKPTHTLADLCQNSQIMDRVMLEKSLVKHQSGVSLLAPPRAFSDVKYVTADGVRQTLALARNLFPYMVVDLDHSFRDEQVQVLSQADVLLLVMRLEFTCLRNMCRTLDYLGELGVNQNRIRVVVNRYGQAQEVAPAKAEEALGLKIFHYVPEDAKTVIRANNNGVPVVVESPWAKVSKSVNKLAAAVNGRPH